MNSTVLVPDGLSFEQAIALTQSLLEQLEQNTLSDTAFEETVAALVGTENGARGFFVTYLSDERPLVDHHIPSVAQALQAAPAVIAPLMVKNLAMSTAMALAHRRNHNESLAQGSDRVRSRTLQLIESLPLPELREQAQQLVVSIDTETGDYQPFLERWGYDPEQRQAIRQAFEQTDLLGR